MFVAEGLSVAAALCIALSGMLIGELKGRVDVIRLARWQMLAAFAMTGAAMLVLESWRTLGGPQIGLLAASSLFGIIVASTSYFAAIYLVGPRVTALLFSLAAPFSLLLGYGILGETIDARQAGGILLVLLGIVLAVGLLSRAPVAPLELPVPPPEPAPLFSSGRVGIVLGIVTALGQALGSLFARPAMAAGVEPFAAMAVRSGVAALFFVLLMALPVAALRRPYVWRASDFGLGVAAAFFGTGLGMSLLMAALARGQVGIVTTLSSMTPVVILPMVWIRTGVAPPPLAWLGAGLAVAGTALISV